MLWSSKEYCNAGPGPVTSEAVEQQGESLSRDTPISVSHTVPTRSTVTQGLGQPPLMLWSSMEYCNAGPGPATSEAVEQQGESLSRDTLISVSHTVPTRSTVTQGLGQPPLRLWSSKEYCNAGPGPVTSEAVEQQVAQQRHTDLCVSYCTNQEYCNAGPGPVTSEAVEQQGGVKCPVCDYVYGTKWEMNRHLKNKHGLKVIQSEVLGLNQWEVVEQSVEEPLTQYLHITETEDPQGTEAAVSALQDLRFTENGVVATTTEGLDPTAVNILQQIIELGAESNDATAASMVAMVPGRVTVVEQVAEEEEQRSHIVMIQDSFQQAASMGLGEEHHLVVSSDDVEGMETVTVYTQGEDASQFIVYVQEAVQTEEHTVESI
ncbi:zinc finger protein ZFAT-like [Oncorhynchus masou masou]|uniref:zinc finger protein ZFAT-like n=1 Tax=Oncorhynchus masou masou TaxID=90313 RepID=UPI003182E22C